MEIKAPVVGEGAEFTVSGGAAAFTHLCQVRT